MKNTLSLISLFVLMACAAAQQSKPIRGGRYDQQIQREVLKITCGSKEYRKVHSEVEDSVVKLTGTVKLESSRVRLEDRVNRVKRVAGVHNQILVDPAPEPDAVVWSRLRSRLNDAGYEEIQIKVHSGMAVISGIARNRKAVRRILQAARLTPGVLEVESHLSTAAD